MQPAVAVSMLLWLWRLLDHRSPEERCRFTLRGVPVALREAEPCDAGLLRLLDAAAELADFGGASGIALGPLGVPGAPALEVVP